ncbi:MAG: hypothetical protein AB8B93_19120 [Pseudomonadales bacterium]
MPSPPGGNRPLRRKTGISWPCSIIFWLLWSPQILAASPAAADSHWHLAATLMGGATRIGPTPYRGQIGTGVLINGTRDGAFPVRAEWDSGAGAALELSYNRGRLRFTGAFSWQFRNDWDLAAPTPSLATVTNVFTNVERAGYLMGVHYRWPISRRWQLELGVGAGLINHKLRTDYKVRAVPGLRPAQLQKSSGSERNRGLFAQSGLSYHFNPRLQGAIHYRYLNSGAISIMPLAGSRSGSGPGSGPGARFRTTLRDHLMLFSLRYRFR